MPPSWSFNMTGSTSSSVRTKSPMTIAPPPSRLNAAHEPNARLGLISTPSSMTWRSFRGIPNLITSPGSIWPGRPIAASTCFQSSGPFEDAELVVCPVARLPQYREAAVTIVKRIFKTRAEILLWKAIVPMVVFSFFFVLIKSILVRAPSIASRQRLVQAFDQIHPTLQQFVIRQILLRPAIQDLVQPLSLDPSEFLIAEIGIVNDLRDAFDPAVLDRELLL